MNLSLKTNRIESRTGLGSTSDLQTVFVSKRKHTHTHGFPLALPTSPCNAFCQDVLAFPGHRRPHRFVTWRNKSQPWFSWRERPCVRSHLDREAVSDPRLVSFKGHSGFGNRFKPTLLNPIKRRMYVLIWADVLFLRTCSQGHLSGFEKMTKMTPWRLG